ncbi:33347_t:CDS:1, partial [Racocetra persica]
VYKDTMLICSEYPTEENEIHELDPKIEMLREMVQKSREKTKILPSRIDIQDEEEQSFQHQMIEDTYKMPRKSNKCRYQNDDDNESPGALEYKMLLKFKKLETAILGFNNRLNSVFAQIQDTRQR